MACQGDIEREKKIKELSRKYMEKNYILQVIKKNPHYIDYFKNLFAQKDKFVPYYTEFKELKTSNKLTQEKRIELMKNIMKFFDTIEFRNLFLNYLHKYKKILYPNGEIFHILNQYRDFVNILKFENHKPTKDKMIEFLKMNNLSDLVNTFDKNMKIIESFAYLFGDIIIPQCERGLSDITAVVLREVMFAVDKIHNNTRLIRQRNRCMGDGRARGYTRFVKLGRTRFRELSARGMLPGFRKASW